MRVEQYVSLNKACSYRSEATAFGGLWFERELMIRSVEQKNEKHGINAAANGTSLKVDLRMSLDAFQWAPLLL
jgi:hypothetical protein